MDGGGASGGPRGRGRAQERGRPPPSWIGCGPPGLDSFASIFYIFRIGCGPLGLDSFASIFYIFQNNSLLIFMSFRELLFLHKNNTMAILLKTASVRVSSIQIFKLESKTRAKVFGKVDMTETYQLPQS